MDTTISTPSNSLPKMTAKSFRDPVLKVVANKIGFTPDQTVSHHDVYGPVCALAGVDPNAYGIAPGTTALQTHRWIQFAVMALRTDGLMTTPRKGQWGLTPSGVMEAQRLMWTTAPVVTAPVAIVETPAPVVMETEAPVKVTLPKPLPVVNFTVDPVFVPYEGDSYLRGLAVAATNCLGYFSARSETCRTCPLHLQCRNKQAADMSGLAAILRREDAESEAEAQRAETARVTAKGSAPAATPEPQGVRLKQWNNTNIDKIVNHVESTCYRCGNAIAVGAVCYWRHDANDSSNSGVFHTECL